MTHPGYSFFKTLFKAGEKNQLHIYKFLKMGKELGMTHTQTHTIHKYFLKRKKINQNTATQR